MKKNLLITGANGAIGDMVLSHLYTQGFNHNTTALVRDIKKANKLKKKYPLTNVIIGDITNVEAVKKAVLGQDIVIHLAAIIPTREGVSDAQLTRVNVEGTKNIIDAMETLSPNAFLLYSSSVAVYGDRLNTDHIHVDDSLPEEFDDAYGFSKIKAEELIRKSNVSWSIFRLTAIMGVGNHKLSPLMFHMPLETEMEFATVRDTAQAFVNAVNHLESLNKKTFNLSGGKDCRITYEGFLTRAFDAYGLGVPKFPKHAFAFQNFHCAFYKDADQLENILSFQKDTTETYFERFRAGVPAIQRVATKIVSPLVKRWLLSLSDPYKAYKKQDKKAFAFFFGDK